MADREFTEECQRIQILMGKLDDAVWKRISAAGEDAFAEYQKQYEDMHPKTAEELAAWDELTSPANNAALHEFIDYFGGNMHDYAKKLDEALIADSDCRKASAAKAAT